MSKNWSAHFGRPEFVKLNFIVKKENMLVESKNLLVMVLALVGVCFVPGVTISGEAKKDYPVRPVPFTDVKISGEFWAPRMETNRKITIPYDFKKCG